MTFDCNFVVVPDRVKCPCFHLHCYIYKIDIITLALKYVSSCMLHRIKYFSSRSLMGLDMRLEYVDLPIPGLGDCNPVCVRENPPDIREQDFRGLQILHCKYEQVKAVLKYK